MADFGFMGGQGNKGSGARAGTRGMGIRGIGPGDGSAAGSASGGPRGPRGPSPAGRGAGGPGMGSHPFGAYPPPGGGPGGYPAHAPPGGFHPPGGGPGPAGAFGSHTVPPPGGGGGYPSGAYAGGGPPAGSMMPGSRRVEPPRAVVPRRGPLPADQAARSQQAAAAPRPLSRPTWQESAALDAYGASEDVEQRMQAFAPTGMPALLPQQQDTGVSGAEVAALKTQVAALREELQIVRESLTAARDESKVFYGLVDGGKSGVVLIYNELPSAENPVPKAPSAKARRGRWLRLCHPRIAFERVSESGPVTDVWFSLHVIDPKTGELSQKWVMTTTPDGSPAFSRFDVLPRDAQPSNGSAAAPAE